MTETNDLKALQDRVLVLETVYKEQTANIVTQLSDIRTSIREIANGSSAICQTHRLFLDALRKDLDAEVTERSMGYGTLSNRLWGVIVLFVTSGLGTGIYYAIRELVK